MIKNDFNDVYDINYDLFGIVSNIKEYKLAWILNKIFSIDLIKFDDLIITKYNQKTFQVSNYFYETDEFIIRVLKNRFAGITGPCCNLKYNVDTGRLDEVQSSDF